MKQVLLYAFFLTLLGSVAMAQPAPGGFSPIISEIMYNPPESGTDSLEFIEILNPNLAASMDISGYYFSAGVEYTFPTGTVIPAAGFIVVAVDSVAFEGVFGYPALEWTGGALSNSGEGITLRTAAGVVADTVFYDDSGDWPIEADQGGYSLVLCDPTMDNNVATNWSISTNNVGVNINALDTYADPYQFFACMTVGVADDNVITTILFPNPTEGVFSLRFEPFATGGTLQIHNSLGQMVYSEAVNSGTSTITVSEVLAKGYYVVSLNQGETVERLKLTIN